MLTVIRFVFSILLTSAIASCGQNPAFTEQPVPSASAADDSSPGSGDASAAAGGAVGGAVGGAASEAVSGAAGSTAGGTTGAGSTAGGTTGAGSTAPTYTPPAGYPAGTPKSDVLVEDGGTLSLPGTKAIKVGVNFEDYTDMDYNDSVLCFTGDFKIQNRKVISYKKQVIKAAIYSNSACTHTLQVQIIHANGVTTSATYNDHTTPNVNLNFDVGSQLFVTMRSISGGCTGTYNMDHPNMVQVIPNVCKR
jgi:hypothetical protein